MKEYGFVYMTTNLINGKRYIGQRVFKRGWEKYLGSGVHLKNAIRKYGRENFERIILEICTDKESLDEAEIKWINEHDAVNNDEFYNIAHGGFGSSSGELHHLYGKHHSSETKSKMSKKASLRVGELNPFYGKTHSNKTKEMIRTSAIGREISFEGRQKISEKTKGENNPMFGRNHTAESNERNRLAHLGKQMSAVSRKKMSENNTNKRQVICLNTGEVFESLTNAGKFFNVHHNHIYRVCKGIRKSCGKDEQGNPLKWMYYDEYLTNKTS